MENTAEFDLGSQKIKKSGQYHYLRVPKQLVDSGILSLDTEYHVKVIVEKKQSVPIEKKPSEVPA